MTPLFAFLFFQLMQPFPPAAEVTPDFRLAGRDGPRAALINISDVTLDAPGRPRTLVYIILEDEPATLLVTEARFDCPAGTIGFGLVSEYDRSFAKLTEDPSQSAAQASEPGSIYAQALSLACSSGEARRTYPYLGSDMRSAVRAADPRFR